MILASVVQGPEPAYCKSSVFNPKITTPAQWAKCASWGWNQPTTTAAHAGYFAGRYVIPYVVIAVIVFFVARAVRRRLTRTEVVSRTSFRPREGAGSR